MKFPLFVLATILLCALPAQSQEPGVDHEIGELRLARETVRQLYLEHLERAPDPQGLETHVRSLMAEEQSVSEIARTLQESPEGQRVLARRRQIQEEARLERKSFFTNTLLQNLHVLYAILFAVVLGLVISQV